MNITMTDAAKMLVYKKGGVCTLTVDLYSGSG